jgi:hypothetical protein
MTLSTLIRLLNRAAENGRGRRKATLPVPEDLPT